MSYHEAGIMRRERGQASVELILIAGFILLMAILVFPYVVKQQEMNKAVAAAREGATTGTALRGMGFSADGGNDDGLVRVERMTVTKTGTYGDLDQYQIKFFISEPTDMRTSNNCMNDGITGTILNQARNHIYYAFNSQWYSGTVPNGVNTTNYRFTTSCEWV
jgi:hypothetical protein